MSDDIRPGDVVVCVDTGPSRLSAKPAVPIIHLLRAGHFYRVSWTGLSNYRDPILALEGVSLPPPMAGFGIYRFRKIDAPKTEISELIRACRPVRVGEPA